MKKIILVQINFSEDHSEKILPLGILAVGTVLKKNGYDIELININETEIAKTAEQIILEDPLYVGLSVMTGVQTAHSAQLSKLIKEKSNQQIKIVWGGIHPSLLPKQCLCEDYIDYVVISEGEISALELTRALEQGIEPQNVLGIGYQQNGQIKINPERPFIANLDNYQLDFTLLDLEQFIFPLAGMKRVIAYKASRGCPFNCAFCYNLIFNHRRWRAWSVETVIKDIEYFKSQYQIDGVKFYDDNFFVNSDRALKILKKISIPAHIEIRIDSITEKLAQQLANNRVFDMLIGVESGSNRLLELIDKKFTVDKTLEAVKILAKYQLPATYSAILGLPTETKEEFNSTIDLMYQIYKIHPQSAFTLGTYLPYPGSRLYDLSLNQGFVPPINTEAWGQIDRFRKDFQSPWVNTKQVWIIRECFKFLNWKIGPIKRLFEARIKFNFFALPFDIYLMEYLSGLALKRQGFLGKLMRWGYNLIKKQK